MTSIDAHTLSLDDIPQAVHTILVEFFAEQHKVITDIDPSLTSFVSKLESFVLDGGKRMRPLFAWAGFIGAGGIEPEHEQEQEDPNAVLRAVSSLELIQACALLHDDIIDSSDTRRGKMTVHRNVEKQHSEQNWSGSSEHFGTSVAILLGDLALTWADDMMHNSGLSATALARLSDPWRAMRTEVIGGQMLDIIVEATGDERVSEAEKISRFKAAAYTIERPLHLGAAIANAPASMVTAYRKFGQDIGIAFQLRDDLLGVFGDPTVTGKPAGDDLREGKRTVLLATALALADAYDPNTAAILRAGVGRVADSAGIAELTSIIRSTGALERVEQRIEELTASGLAYLDEAQIKPQVRDTLRTLAIRATSRKK